MKKLVISVQDACCILRNAGIPASVEKVKVGLQTGVYPWGSYFKSGTLLKADVYDVYPHLLEKWIANVKGESHEGT